MIKKVFLGLGPMSIEIIDSLDYFSKKYQKKIMLICSRNQIESSFLGGGYVNNFSTQTFSQYIKSKKNKYLLMCRDHGGPFKRDRSFQNKINKEVDDCKKSFADDIFNDFKIIHVDTSECGKSKYEIAEDLIEFCNYFAKESNKDIHLEFGCEDHGVMTNFSKFRKDAKFFSKFKNKQFIVCQTGSLVKSVFQVGQFDIDSINTMKQIAKEYEILLKEHNCDYLNHYQINLRKEFGIDALNIAPELGFLQSNLIFYLCKKYGIDKQLDKFIKVVLLSNKWKKWKYGNENNFLKFLSSAHYHFNCDEYISIKEKLSRKINFQNKLDKVIEKKLLLFF
tara:strand:- start:4335 stop:5342 length:1008 start_codon:yes stop_codon:yes gene_type:complete